MGKTTRPMLDPKLWRVEIAYVAYVMSDNHDDAIYEANGVPTKRTRKEMARG